MDFSEDSSSSSDDEDLFDLALIIAFPRRAKIIRPRTNHFEKWLDQEFIDRFRLSKATTLFVLDLIKDQISHQTTRNHAVSAQNQLLIALRYYATGSFLRVSADFTGVERSTCGRIVRRVSKALATLRPHFIKFPTTAEEVETVKQGFYRIAKCPRCIGAIDCTHIKIRSPGGDNAELYRNRKQFFSINVQTICDSNLQIQNIVCRWPGSAHDANIFKNSIIRSKFEHGLMGNNLLVGDSGYPLKKYLMTPLSNPQTIAEERYNESQIRTRNPIERSYGVWKRRFPILAIGINVDLETAKTVIVATAVLYNIANTLRDKTIIVNPQLEEDIELINHVPVDRVNNTTNTPQQIIRRSLVNYFGNL